MTPTALKTFLHPHGVYRLEYPAHWDQVIEKDGAACGFGPHERDDVGLWISIMPVSVDTDRLAEDLPRLIEHGLGKADAANLRPDPTLRHHGLVADVTKAGEGGNYWVVAGGDVVLFASSQVPAAERDEWNPPFQRVMASLQITRDDQLLQRRVANEVLAQLRERQPDEGFEFDGGQIRGKGQVVYLGNLYREVRASPSESDRLIRRFVDALSRPGVATQFGHETWGETRGRVLPLLKPRDYVGTEGPTAHLHTSEWLADVLICYAIPNKKMYRFVTGWDLGRWGIDAAGLHQAALDNLARLPWPEKLVGARASDAGRVLVVATEDGLSSSRLLHPELHRLFGGPLGSPFWAGIPCRNTLVLYSDRKVLKRRIGVRLRKDHRTSAHPITPRPFLVTRDGIAPGPD
jgi:hypothetical protein